MDVPPGVEAPSGSLRLTGDPVGDHVDDAVGGLCRAVAAVNGWTVVDMQKDWKVIFPFELK